MSVMRPPVFALVHCVAIIVPSGDQIGAVSLTCGEWVRRFSPVPSAFMT